MESIREKLNDIPKKPGVYEFLDKDGGVLYVGKAKNLRSRVSQYVHGSDERPQLPFLAADTADVRYTVVNTELESLFLENTLIKKYRPKYNILLRDDKNYAFITVDFSCPIPQISYARKFDRTNKKITYFGPYSAAWKIRNTLNLIRKIFPYCSNKTVGKRPCFYYYLHRCPGVCVGAVSLPEYKKQIDRICAFLRGDERKIKNALQQDMAAAAVAQQFEKAARIRDQYRALELLEEKQSVILTRPVSWDIISATSESGYACVNLFKIRDGKMVDKENFVYEKTLRAGAENPKHMQTEALQAFLEQYYLETSDVPDSLYLEAVENPEIIRNIIWSRFRKKTNIFTPQRGKAAELVRLGSANAEEYIKHWLTAQAGHLDSVQRALEGLRDELHLPAVPRRMECYDISNTQGTNPVGSMVVFENGLPAKNQYRKFKIHGKKTPDDFAMMREMLTRRCSRIQKQGTGEKKTLWEIPDLIVIDGGKGQLAVAVDVLQKNQPAIPVVGLAKRIEEIFFPGNPQPLVLPHDNPSLQMLQRLRDEAHRFGITFHRSLRSKQAIRSALDDIPGIGPKTKSLLKKKFGTVADIRKTPPEKLAEAVGEKMARTIHQFLL